LTQRGIVRSCTTASDAFGIAQRHAVAVGDEDRGTARFEGSGGVDTFLGGVQLRGMRGVFPAELAVSDLELRLRPRVIPAFRKAVVRRGDVSEVRLGPKMLRGLEVATSTGVMDRFDFVPVSYRQHRRIRLALIRHGYPVV
jgi:hypothetical protein